MLVIMKPCYIRVTKTIQYKGNLPFWDHKNYLVIMKPRYISARYNESPLYNVKFYIFMTLSGNSAKTHPHFHKLCCAPMAINS